MGMFLERLKELCVVPVKPTWERGERVRRSLVVEALNLNLVPCAVRRR